MKLFARNVRRIPRLLNRWYNVNGWPKYGWFRNSQSERAVSAKLPSRCDRYRLQPATKTQMHRFLRVSLKSNFGHYSYSNYRKPRAPPASSPYLTFYCRGCWRMKPWKLVLESCSIWICRFTYGNWAFLPRPSKIFRNIIVQTTRPRILSPRSHLTAKRISLEIFRTPPSSSIFLEKCYSKKEIFIHSFLILTVFKYNISS